MATKSEDPGYLADRPDALVCAYCGKSSNRYAYAQLKDRHGKLQEHRLCANCHEKVVKGLEVGEKDARERKEFKPTRRIERAGSSDYRREGYEYE